jgi:hypothetical protein
MKDCPMGSRSCLCGVFPIKNPTPLQIAQCGRTYGVAFISYGKDGSHELVNPHDIQIAEAA